MSDMIAERVSSFYDWIEDTHDEVDGLNVEDLENLITKCKGFTKGNCSWITYDAVQYILERATDKLGEFEYEE